MRICLVSSSFYPATFYGGPIAATWDLSKKLSEKGVDVFVSATNANGKTQLDEKRNQFIQKKDHLWVKYYHEQIINKLSFAFIFGIWADIKKADLIYIQYLFHYTVLCALLFSIIQKKKVVICPRGSFSKFTFSNKLTALKKVWFYLFIKPFQNKIKWHASSYLETIDIKRVLPKSDVKEVNDGVDFASFQNTETLSSIDLVLKYTNQSFPEIDCVLFSMGRLHQIKRFDVLIDAFHIFIKENPTAKLLIAGEDDGVKQALEEQIKELDLMNSVFLTGSVNHQQKKQLLTNATAFALASEFESFGIVVAEALSCGCPVVVSNKTPWKDIEKNNCGILAENERVSFCNAINLIRDKNYQKEDCKKYVKSHFDWEVISKDFINSFLTEK
ncbi:MAG: glycosyltransferase [Bacteroidota bacterium]|nr:glycosyltransferase [Bacteroidota bacterium]